MNIKGYLLFSAFAILIATAGLAGCGGPTGAVNLISNFQDTSLEGWEFHPGDMTNPGSDGVSGQENDGFLLGECPSDSDTSWFIAPETYHRDWTAYRELRLHMWTEPGEYYSHDRGDIFLANGSKTAAFQLPEAPAEEWEAFVIKLDDDDGWEFGGGATSLEEVLQNVTRFEIRAEYIIGRVKVGLDQVKLIAR